MPDNAMSLLSGDDKKRLKLRESDFPQAHADTIKLLYTVGYGVSLGSLIIAVIIMCCGRYLWRFLFRLFPFPVAFKKMALVWFWFYFV